jgi:protein involved in polysaccharide export with SLBB domain
LAQSNSGGGTPTSPQTSQSGETQASGQNATPTSDQGSDAQGDQSGNAQGANPAAMSAEQIIGILQQEPTILADVKNEAARQTGVDPSSITDDELFSRIRQDANLRVQITSALNKLGYSTNRESSTATASTAPGANIGPPRESAPAVRVSPVTQPTPYVEPDKPQEVRRPIPYGDLPSMRDLYAQTPTTMARLQRFGSDAFQRGTGNANELPMDLPAGPDYVLGPGDNLIVNMWGGVSNRLDRIIDRQGQIQLPEAGTIVINGLTIAEAQQAIQKSLSTQYENEHVEISLGRIRTVRIYVVGDVQRPGAYDVSSLSTPLSALYAAGGPTSRGSLRLLKQFRGNQLVREIDLYDFLLKGVRSNNDHLMPGDTILVPPVGPQVTVQGMVRRPAIYEMNGESTLNQVLDLAGGVLVSASLKQINVERIIANQRRTMLSLQLPDNVEEEKQKLADFRVQDGDDVGISQILPYNQQAVYLEGHVYRPGKYAYREGMTINDVLHSYQDVMPEPADHAELIRLVAPDFRPVTVSFNLHDALLGNDSFLIQPYDLIHIFGRYEIDPPRVAVEGEVLRPGEYPMSEGMTVAGLVKMAGGFKRSAYRDEADLASYVIQGGQKVLVNHSIVAVNKALEGDKSADVTLKPGDVVSVRRLAGWQDIGASVTINGEVEHAGSYGIQDGERLSSVLKRAGGFREYAYPDAAVLERVQVRELAEQARQQMIARIENMPLEVRPGAASGQSQVELQQTLQTQRQGILTALRSRPASGRLVINISLDISKWENTSADIELRAGDTLLIPKRPAFVMVSGQVYNATAVSYVPRRNLEWYLEKTGGPTRSGDKRRIYVLHANGSVVIPRKGGTLWMGGGFSLQMEPGDTIIVPEKMIGSSTWQSIVGVAQVMAATSIPLAAAGVF